MLTESAGVDFSPRWRMVSSLPADGSSRRHRKRSPSSRHGPAGCLSWWSLAARSSARNASKSWPSAPARRFLTGNRSSRPWMPCAPRVRSSAALELWARWGRRGRIVDAYLASVPPRAIFLGDNGGRPIGLPGPKQFAHAALARHSHSPGFGPVAASSRVRAGGEFRLRASSGDQSGPTSACA